MSGVIAGMAVVAAGLEFPEGSVATPDGTLVEQVDTGDTHTTNICFGGPDMRTAFITRAGVGDVIFLPWARPGLSLVY